MSFTIHKAELRMITGSSMLQVQTVQLPVGAEVVHAGHQQEVIYIWYRYDRDQKEREPRYFSVCGTGMAVSRNSRHIASFAVGGYHPHVFEEQTATGDRQ